VDQRYSLPVSVKAGVGNEAFRDGRKLRPWASWKINVPRELFPDQYYVRLRGATIYVVPEGGSTSDNAKGVWIGSLEAPAKTFCEHLTTDGMTPVRVDLDQGNVPTAMAGRITYRDYVRTPDVVGISSLANVSPFGD
jgi:hypothetical protein